MKRLITATVLIILCCTVSFATKVVAEGKTHSVLGDYKIESLDNPVMINGKELKAFVVTYQNTGLKTTIAVKKTFRCKTYYVLSDMLAVQYVCNGHYFGIQRLDKKLEKDGYVTSDENLDNFQYYHQKVLSCGTNTDIENTQLIAAYFPFLFKNTEEVLAVK
jgi:uncharacterized CHY-type Zn-finger protein